MPPKTMNGTNGVGSTATSEELRWLSRQARMYRAIAVIYGGLPGVLARAAGPRRRCVAAAARPLPPTAENSSAQTRSAAGEEQPRPHRRTRPAPGLREHCDELVEHLADDLEARFILAALGKSAGAMPGRPRTFAGNCSACPLRSTRTMPTCWGQPRRPGPRPPPPHFGLTPGDQAQLNALAASARF